MLPQHFGLLKASTNHGLRAEPWSFWAQRLQYFSHVSIRGVRWSGPLRFPRGFGIFAFAISEFLDFLFDLHLLPRVSDRTCFFFLGQPLLMVFMEFLLESTFLLEISPPRGFFILVEQGGQVIIR